MNTKQQKDLNLTLALSVQMQLMLHTLDKLFTTFFDVFLSVYKDL